MSPSELATADLRRRAGRILRRIQPEHPDVTAARRAELEQELASLARRNKRQRRARAYATNTTRGGD